jgi:hypothetical protein
MIDDLALHAGLDAPSNARDHDHRGVIHPPFRLADELTNPSDEHALLDFINQRLRPRFHGWVREAEKLAR